MTLASEPGKRNDGPALAAVAARTGLVGTSGMNATIFVTDDEPAIRVCARQTSFPTTPSSGGIRIRRGLVAGTWTRRCRI